MAKIGICGHFGGKNNFYDGQTVKTKIITEELTNIYGKNDVITVDTYGGIKKTFFHIIKLLRLLAKCDNIIILPAHNSLRIFAPLLALFNKFYKKRLHYIVIGGWLPDFIKTRNYLSKSLKKFDYIYTETSTMKKNMEKQGFDNIIILPNCKKLNILKPNELVYNTEAPFKLCTFSRVMKEKGIEDAVNAVTYINNKYNKTCYTLDIYGQVDANQTEWFDNLKNNFPSYVEYKGAVPFDKSTEVLKNYYALLFPTYYDGEGFAGTIIDSMASGVPVIASDWRYNSEFISDNVSGRIYKTFDNDSFIDILIDTYNNPSKWNDLKINCINKASNYKAQNVVKIITNKLI